MYVINLLDLEKQKHHIYSLKYSQVEISCTDLQQRWDHVQVAHTSSFLQNLSCAFYRMQSCGEISEHARFWKIWAIIFHSASWFAHVCIIYIIEILTKVQVKACKDIYKLLNLNLIPQSTLKTYQLGIPLAYNSHLKRKRCQAGFLYKISANNSSLLVQAFRYANI